MTRNDFLVAAGSDIVETPLLYYVGGYKYQSRNDVIYQVFIYPAEDIITDLIILRKDGWLWVSKYFAWDGCSGPTIDDATNMRAGQAHDALYALMRMGLLPLSWRPQSDKILRNIMVQDGAWRQRAKYYEWAVRKFAKNSASPKNARKIKTAPHKLPMGGMAPA